MIYNDSFLKREFKETYFEHSMSIRKRLEYALFLALISFGVHFILLTLTKSVLSNTAPRYINQSYFSVISTYIDISYFFYVVYLTVSYNYLTFTEIKSNKWYILMKYGFNPIHMIFTKLYARLITAFSVYGTGFLLILFLTSFLKYPFVLEYILPLFILGLLDIVFIIVVTMTSSLYLKKGLLLDYIVVLLVCLLAFLKYVLGYYSIIKDKSQFNSIGVLSHFLQYIVVLCLIIIVCIITIFIRAKINAKYYYFSFYVKDLDFPDDVRIVMSANAKTSNRTVREYEVKTISKTKIASKLINVLLITIITIFIIFNIVVMLISLSSQSQEISIMNIIPYVFQSETMQPTIMYNDLAFFKKIDQSEPLISGDIVIYKAREEVNVGRIQMFQAKKIVVDIDNYPSQNTSFVYREAISKNQIYGKYNGRSRWLGLLILFSNTTTGRLLLLLIPSILLFYHKPIIEFIKYITYERQKEQ